MRTDNLEGLKIVKLAHPRSLVNLCIVKPKTCETCKLRNLQLLENLKLRNLVHVKHANPQSLVNICIGKLRNIQTHNLCEA